VSARYAVQSLLPPRDLLSWHGRVLVHDNRDELEFLLAGAVRVVECPRDIPPEQCLEIRHHPQFAHHRFPLGDAEYLDLYRQGLLLHPPKTDPAQQPGVKKTAAGAPTTTTKEG
jgi:hypothetical protein